MSDQRVSVPSFIEPRPPLILNPYMRPRPQKGVNLLPMFEDDSESEEPEWVQVFLRLKPCKVRNNLYEVRSERCLITSVDTAPMGHGRRTQHNVSKMYTFSHIFGPESNQKEIFEQVVKDNLRKLPEGHNFTLLTYGASGSGKTYTLMGTVQAPGLVPRSLEYVFRIIDAAQQPMFKPFDGGAEKLEYYSQEYEIQFVKRLRQVSAPLQDKYRRMSVQLRNDLTASNFDLSNRTRYFVWVSFVEIYNEAIYDLLSNCDRSKATSKLRLREDSNGNVYVKGATQAFVRSGEEAYDILVAGKHNLQVAATGVHANSSRSHCIFTITLLTETDEGVRSSCVRLCDLAGCERARNTRNTGARMQESRAINSSLHVLERCLHMLRRKQRKVDATLVPYRESKLTRLLGAGLSGARGEAVSMVVTLNPAPEYAHETKHVLQLAAVAKDIQVNQTIAESTLESSSLPDTNTTIESSAELMRLRAENERLHFELVQAESRNKELLAAMEQKQQETATTMYEIAEEAKDMTRQYYEAQLQSLRQEMEELQEEYEHRLKTEEAHANIMRDSHTEMGTPSRSLQRRIAELMTEIAVLQENLSAEKLARARAEEEVQHLRACIEERDRGEKRDSESGQDNEDVMLVYDSDEEAEISNDESLEPTFKKEDINRSRMLRKSLINDSKLDTTHDISQNVPSDNESLKNYTLKDEENTQDVTIKDDYTTDESNTTNVTKNKDSTYVSDESNVTHKMDVTFNNKNDKMKYDCTTDESNTTNVSKNKDTTYVSDESNFTHKMDVTFNNQNDKRNHYFTDESNTTNVTKNKDTTYFSDESNAFNRTDATQIRNNNRKYDFTTDESNTTNVTKKNDTTYVSDESNVTFDGSNTTPKYLANIYDHLNETNTIKKNTLFRGTYVVRDEDIKPKKSNVVVKEISSVSNSIKNIRKSVHDMENSFQNQIEKSLEETVNRMSDRISDDIKEKLYNKESKSYCPKEESVAEIDTSKEKSKLKTDKVEKNKSESNKLGNVSYHKLDHLEKVPEIAILSETIQETTKEQPILIIDTVHRKKSKYSLEREESLDQFERLERASKIQSVPQTIRQNNEEFPIPKVNKDDSKKSNQEIKLGNVSYHKLDHLEKVPEIAILSETIQETTKEQPILIIDTVDRKKSKYSLEREESLDQFERLERASKIQSVPQTIRQNNEEFPIPKVNKDDSKKSNHKDGILAQCQRLEKEFKVQNASHVVDEDTDQISNLKVGIIDKSKPKSSYHRNPSLAQFELLEKAAKIEKLPQVIPETTDILSSSNILKGKRNYFDEDSEVDLVPKLNKDKSYFDNINVIVATHKQLSEVKSLLDDERSPSIVKEDIGNNFEPSTIKRLLGESLTRQPDLLSSVTKLSLPKKPASVDIFEGFDSPCGIKPKEVIKVLEKTTEVSNDHAKKSSTPESTSTLHQKDDVNDIKSNSDEKCDMFLKPTDKDISKGFLNKTATELRTQNNIETHGFLNKTTTEPRGTSIFATCIEKFSLEPKCDNIETTRKSMEKLALKSDIVVNNEKMDCKIEKLTIKSENVDESVCKNDAEVNRDNTCENFEKIYKELSTTRATEFELLVSSSNQTNVTVSDDTNDDFEKPKYNFRRNKLNLDTEEGNSKRDKSGDKGDSKKSNGAIKKDVTNKSDLAEKRTRSKKDITLGSDTTLDQTGITEDVLQTQAKCESKTKPKRNLRLRRRKNQEDDDLEQEVETKNNVKLRDIVNLQKEFSDVTMDVPAPVKEVKDIESPEKRGDENVPPLLGVQSCPSKSVTRSRRKLFTPRAEVLEESMTASGDSHETVRVRVPRPSYHRTRARRKL